ncbi:MAG: hypothetical protein ABSF16_15975 [Terracidiphilus sp.]
MSVDREVHATAGQEAGATYFLRRYLFWRGPVIFRLPENHFMSIGEKL